MQFVFEIRVSGSEWAVAHAACGCDGGQGGGDGGHDDLKDKFPDVLCFHNIIGPFIIFFFSSNFSASAISLKCLFHNSNIALPSFLSIENLNQR